MNNNTTISISNLYLSNVCLPLNYEISSNLFLPILMQPNGSQAFVVYQEQCKPLEDPNQGINEFFIKFWTWSHSCEAQQNQSEPISLQSIKEEKHNLTDDEHSRSWNKSNKVYHSPKISNITGNFLF